jgi:hypothetical protein
MVRLLGVKHDCWRVRKSLEVLSKLFDKDGECCILVTVDIFDSLATIIWRIHNMEDL